MPDDEPQDPMLAEPTLAVPEDTPENVRAERQRRIDASEPYGYKVLADHFSSTVTTIRRRLGKNVNWK